MAGNQYTAIISMYGLTQAAPKTKEDFYTSLGSSLCSMPEGEGQSLLPPLGAFYQCLRVERC